MWWNSITDDWDKSQPLTAIRIFLYSALSPVWSNFMLEHAIGVMCQEIEHWRIPLLFDTETAYKLPYEGLHMIYSVETDHWFVQTISPL